MKKGKEEVCQPPDLPPRAGSLIALLKADFAAHGADVIEVVRRKHPTIYLRLVADELPQELSKAALELGDIGDEELAQIIGHLRKTVAAADGKPARPRQARE
jgi:hypothetical protein